MVQKRQRLGVDERRTQFLELGLDLFADRPYDAVAIEDVAAAAGVSKGLLYHYFGSKRGYYVEAVRFASERLLESLNPHAELPLPDRLEAGIEAYLDFVEGRANAYISLMRGGGGVDDEVVEIVNRARDQIVAQTIEALEIPETPLLRLALRAWLGAAEAVCLEWLEGRGVERERMVALLMELMLATLAAAAR